MLSSSTLDYIFQLRRRGIKIGLHRTEALLSRCGNPHYDLPVIHIAGTNGKGSTAAIIASILHQEGNKVGLYTSPHLICFNERIRINGIPISDENITSFLNRFRPDIDILESTFFETTTALAFSFFAQEKVDIAVIEVGLGGRLDSTNVSKSVLSVITPIHFDHMEFLGHDLTSITREKCGIIKKNVPVVVADQLPEVAKIVEEEARVQTADVFTTQKKVEMMDISLKESDTSFSYDGCKMKISLVGRHQIINTQTAITAVKTLFPEITTKIISSALKNIRWPGRLQKLLDNPPVFYDVAHNAHGLKATLMTLRELFPDYNINALCALKKTKDVTPVAEILKTYCKEIITTSIDREDFWIANNLSEEFRKFGINSVSNHSIAEAITEFKQKTADNEIRLIFGTHFIAETVYNIFDFPFDNGII
ncbi:MAG: folylpolyglutamate synthase/dihydrofolate synthase family protein [Candidatus Marinimicrobia bacterium]|jgi:dihydrofolate synthase/folylpolyglutamate synthase|nr:folylpolyglutamate synthase/dihydrofolate synthase family protein [Candidatus Neomarinimicrobiota bacterium]MDP7025364.1 folylpolyglutamate synthase/dihydrofolate synthase family protein [Candidatus Neomarinimicrobiota bacterium]|tara:strand:+ start:4258 stop:5526 length:1269 start_codon:yes stop_codon:yes gene_type:complete